MKTFIITEAGSSWRFGTRHLTNGKRCIWTAKEIGANAVKFQWTSNPHLMEKRRKVEPFTYDMLDYPKSWIQQLAAYCEDIGIEFMCTVFCPEDVEHMNRYVKRWKVASLEHGATDLLQAMSKTKKDILISCGVTDEANDRWEYGKPLHCTAAYPAPPESLNLLAIENLNYAGYSDHSGHVLTGALSVACGASIVEVHMRLDRTPKANPDYPHSLCPARLREYVDNIRLAEKMLGSGNKKIEDCEKALLKHRVMV